MEKRISVIGEDFWEQSFSVLLSQVFISQGMFVPIIVSRHFIPVFLIGTLIHSTSTILSLQVQR